MKYPKNFAIFHLSEVHKARVYYALEIEDCELKIKIRLSDNFNFNPFRFD